MKGVHYMKLEIKIKPSIIFVAKNGKKEIEIKIQKIKPEFIQFKMLAAMPFTDDDVKYMLKSVPEYDVWISDIKRYVNELEGSKQRVLINLQSQFHKLVDTTTSDCKVKLEVKISHSIIYNENIDTEYFASLMSYDPTDENILHRI